jgi:hypothetical protein
MAETDTPSRRQQAVENVATDVGYVALGFGAIVAGIKALPKIVESAAKLVVSSPVVAKASGAVVSTFIKRVVPIVGGALGAWEAGRDTTSSFFDGNYWRAAYSGIESLAFGISTAAFAISPFFPPAAIVGGVTGLIGLGMFGAKMAYDNRDDLLGMVGYDMGRYNENLSLFIAALPKPDQINTPKIALEFSHMHDAGGHFEAAMEYFKKDQFIDNNGVETLSKLSPAQQYFLKSSPQERAQINQRMDQIISNVVQASGSSQQRTRLQKDQTLEGQPRVKSALTHTGRDLKRELGKLTFDELLALEKATTDPSKRSSAAEKHAESHVSTDNHPQEERPGGRTWLKGATAHVTGAEEQTTAPNSNAPFTTRVVPSYNKIIDKNGAAPQ